MRLAFFGAARSVTGSCFLVESGGHRLLIDCGLFQGDKAIKERNYREFPFEPASIDAVIVTHAHVDHIGLLPKLVRHGFRGPIYATAPTVDLAGILLADSAHIQLSEVERKNRKLARQGAPLLTPIYTPEDVARCMDLFQAVEFEQRFRPVAAAPGIEARLHPSGHILGSAIVELAVEEEGPRAGGRGRSPDGSRGGSESRPGGPIRLVFSGDLGGWDRPVVPDPALIEQADYVVMESTYGNRRRPRNDERYEELARIIEETFRRGGNVVIPAFAVERTQDLLYGLNRLIHEGKLRPADIYVDSPLAVSATRVFQRHVESFDEEARAFAKASGRSPIYLPQLRLSVTVEESKAINEIKKGAIIISASGMADAGRIKHHLKHNLWRPECSVVFVGYQAEGTLGRRIVEGESPVRIHGEPVEVRAQVHLLEGFSAHAGQGELLAWIRGFRRPPAAVFLVHGEEEALTTLKALVEEDPGCRTIIPDYLTEYELVPVAAPAEAGAAVETGTPPARMPGEAEVPSPAPVAAPALAAASAAPEAGRGATAGLESALWQASQRLAQVLDRLQRMPLSPGTLNEVLQRLEEAEQAARRAAGEGE